MSSTLLERFPSRAKNQVRLRILRERKSVREIANPAIIHVDKIKGALAGIQITIKEAEAAIVITIIATITTTTTTATTATTIQTTGAVRMVQIVIAMKTEFVR